MLYGVYRFQKRDAVKNDINISAHPFHLCISFQMSKNTMGKKRAPLYTRNKNKEKITRKGWECIIW